MNEVSDVVGDNLDLEEMFKEIFVEGIEYLDFEILKNKFQNVNNFVTKCKEKKQKEIDKNEKDENDSVDLKSEEIVGPKYDEETQKLIEGANIARKEFEDVEGQIGQLQDDIRFYFLFYYFFN